jgi:hypothetical protein
MRVVLFLCALLSVAIAADSARAGCLLCRCVYFANPSLPPIKVSSSFPAWNTRACQATCADIRIQCAAPFACASVVGRYQALGGVPDTWCPNPPPYASPNGRGGVSIGIRRY